jgi:GNAT superfamily N-acetyltransferase
VLLDSITIRLATDDDVPALRRLVNAAYAELAEMGLNYTGTFQDEDITRERMQGNDVYVAFLGEDMIGTISLEVQEENQPILYISQLGVHPQHKRKGLGRLLLELAEREARERGINRLQLDTATPATHLVSLYLSLGYKIIQEVRWGGKNYSSYIMEKNFSSQW